MSGVEKLAVVLIFLGALWLLWNGRAGSPKRKRQDARFDALLEHAIRDKFPDDADERIARYRATKRP